MSLINRAKGAKKKGERTTTEPGRRRIREKLLTYSHSPGDNRTPLHHSKFMIVRAPSMATCSRCSGWKRNWRREAYGDGEEQMRQTN
jgi:hypothetical protein